MPSFVARVERPDRGGEWIGYLRERDERAPARWVARLGLDRDRGGRRRPAARRCGCCTSTATRRRCSPRCSSRPPAQRGGRRAMRRRPRSAATSAPRCSATSSASASNRRHRPGRGFEALRYRFEIVSDYGAFRDLQRHRMLTVQWQRADARTSAPACPRRSTPPACGDEYRARARASRAREYERLVGAGHDARGALRAVPRLPHPLRARPQRARGDAAHRAALRARGPPVLPRRRPRDAPPDRAVHPAVAAAMRHVDTETEPRLERILSEMRTQAKLAHAGS